MDSTLPNIVITPTDTVWSVTYEACCDDGTCDSGVLNGTADCVPTISTNNQDYDVLFGVGQDNVAYPNFDLSTLVTSDACCGTVTYSITSTTNATHTGTLPNIVVTPTDDNWSINFEVCCSDGTTCANGTLNGTSCTPTITAGDENFDT